MVTVPTNQGFPCSLQHQPSLFFRAKLLWAKRCIPAFQALSLNVIQEVCEYYHHSPKILAFHEKQVYIFDPCTRTGSSHFELSGIFGGIADYTFMGPDRVLMMLMKSNPAHINNPYFCVYQNGQIRRVGPPDRQYYHALIYDERKDIVYIMAGEFLHREFWPQTKRCEKFNPKTQLFEPMTSMSTERTFFGYCWHHGYIYLCGGTLPGIELFNPRTETFAPLLLAEGDFSTDCNLLAVSFSGKLALVSNQCIYVGQDGKWDSLTRSKNSNKLLPSFKHACLTGSTLHYTEYDQVVALSLVTGKETSYCFQQQ